MNRLTIKNLTRTLAIAVAAGGFLAGCGGGAQGELFKGCMKQGGATESQCKCFAKEMSGAVPSHIARATGLEMQGKGQEAAALMEKVSFEDRAKFGMAGLGAAAKCAGMN